jgi:hypothetical protein
MKQEDIVPTTKKCSVCGNTNLILFPRENEKICLDHEKYVRMPWKLEKGQVRDYE